jgi:multidrug efflux pump subunit AcrA (membrane-fusion protein)
MPKILLPALSLAGVIFAIYAVAQAQKVDPPAPPVIQPTRTPFPVTISGSGAVEAANEHVTGIGPPLNALILKVYVTVGATVSEGTPLFRLDDRSLQAQRLVQITARDVARAKLAQLVAQPRPELVPALEAQVAQSQAVAESLKAQVKRLEDAYATSKGDAVSLDDLDQRRWALMAAEKMLDVAKAQLALTKAGAWAVDIAESKAELAMADETIRQTETEIDRYTVKAPSDGTILQVNVRDGEYAVSASPDPSAPPLIVFGDTATLNVRVDVDQESSPLVRQGSHAYATLRGFPAKQVPLEFVRIEPYVQIKKSLTGDNTERVDTRVLQVIFRLGRHDLPIYVGQQLDVYIEAVGHEGPVSAPLEPAR